MFRRLNALVALIVAPTCDTWKCGLISARTPQNKQTRYVWFDEKAVP